MSAGGGGGGGSGEGGNGGLCIVWGNLKTGREIGRGGGGGGGGSSETYTEQIEYKSREVSRYIKASFSTMAEIKASFILRQGSAYKDSRQVTPEIMANHDRIKASLGRNQGKSWQKPR